MKRREVLKQIMAVSIVGPAAAAAAQGPKEEAAAITPAEIAAAEVLAGRSYTEAERELMAKRAGATVVEVKASHAIFVSQPQAVATLIEKAATGVQATATR